MLCLRAALLSASIVLPVSQVLDASEAAMGAAVRNVAHRIVAGSTAADASQEG